MAIDNSLPAATVAPRPSRRKSRGWLYSPAGMWTVRVATLAGLLVVWQVYASGLNRALLAPPSEIAAAFYEQAIVQQRVWGALGDSLVTLFTGFAVSMIIGVPVGIL